MKASKEVHLILLKDAFFGIVDNFSDISLIYFCLESLWSPDQGLGTPERKMKIFLFTKIWFSRSSTTIVPLRFRNDFHICMVGLQTWYWENKVFSIPNLQVLVLASISFSGLNDWGPPVKGKRMTELENSTKARNSSKLHIYFPSAIFTSAVALYRKDTLTIHINSNIKYKNVCNFNQIPSSLLSRCQMTIVLIWSPGRKKRGIGMTLHLFP